MSERSRGREVRVGLFVVAAALLLGAGTLWIVGMVPFGGERVRYEVALPESAGVSRGDRVRIAGVPAGRVERIELRPDAQLPVVMQVSLESGLAVREGASARLTSDGLLGNVYVEIAPGDPGAETLPPGSVIRGTGEASLDQVIARAEEVAAEAAELVTAANELLAQVTRQTEPFIERMDRLLSEQNVEELSRTLAVLRRTAEETGPQVRAIAERLNRVAEAAEEGSRDVPDLLAELRAVTADLRAALGPEGARLAETMDAARQGFVSAEEALGVVGASGGDLTRTLDDLRSAAAALEDLARRIEERPSSLIGIGQPEERRPGQGVERRQP